MSTFHRINFQVQENEILFSFFNEGISLEAQGPWENNCKSYFSTIFSKGREHWFVVLVELFILIVDKPQPSLWCQGSFCRNFVF